MYVSCLGCGCRLQMPSNAPAVSCPRCTMVTPIADPRARASASAAAAAQLPPQASSAAMLAPRASAASAQSEDQAIEEAIRRSLGQAPDPTAPNAGQTPSPPAPQLPSSGSAGAGVVDDTDRAVAVSAVSDVTGCDADVAAFLLEANGWQVEAAVNQFLENGMGADMPDAAAAASSPLAEPPSAEPPAPTSESLFVPTPLAVILDGESAPANPDAPAAIPLADVLPDAAPTSQDLPGVPAVVAHPAGPHAVSDLLGLSDQPANDATRQSGGAVDDLLGIFEPAPLPSSKDDQVSEASSNRRHSPECCTATATHGGEGGSAAL